MTHAERRERRKQIAETIKSEMLTLSTAAKRFKVCLRLCEMACIEHGVKPFREPPNRVSANSFSILKRLLDGARQVDLARELNITKQRVGQIATNAKRAGFKLPHVNSK